MSRPRNLIAGSHGKQSPIVHGVVRQLSICIGVRVAGIVAYAIPLGDTNCDFDADGACSVADVDMLVGAIVSGANDPRFDLTGDDTVDQADLDQWLAAGAQANGFGLV